MCGAQELVDRLLEQIKPFGAEMHFGQEVTRRCPNARMGRFDVTTSGGLVFDAGTVVIAGGVGSFQPRRLGAEGVDAFEGKQVFYRVKAAAEFHGKHLVIFGGGDSALDWTLDLVDKAASMTLVHGVQNSAPRLPRWPRCRRWLLRGRCDSLKVLHSPSRPAGDVLSAVQVKDHTGVVHDLPADRMLAFFGLAPKLGPIAEWGIELEKKALKVDTEKFQTSVPGIFAVGDINTYPGKKKLILSGFPRSGAGCIRHPALLYPEKRQFLQYTTTSPVMHKRLGVPDAPA